MSRNECPICGGGEVDDFPVKGIIEQCASALEKNLELTEKLVARDKAIRELEAAIYGLAGLTPDGQESLKIAQVANALANAKEMMTGKQPDDNPPFELVATNEGIPGFTKPSYEQLREVNRKLTAACARLKEWTDEEPMPDLTTPFPTEREQELYKRFEDMIAALAEAREVVG